MEDLPLMVHHEGMTKYKVYLESTASLTITVNLDVTGMDEDDIEDAVIAAAYKQKPNDELCIHCGGYGKSWSRDLGQSEPVDDRPVEKIEG